MTEILQTGVDPTWTGVRLQDRRALGDGQGQERNGRLYRTAVSEVAPRTYGHLDVVSQPEALSHLRRRIGSVYLDLVDLGVHSGPVCLRQERGPAGVAMSAREPVGREPSDWSVLPHEDTPPVLGDDLAFGAKFLDGLSCCHPSDAVMPGQLRLRREPVTRLQLAAFDRCSQVVGDLPIRGPVILSVKRTEHRALSSSHPDER